MTDEILAAATIEKTPEQLRAEQAGRDVADAKAKKAADEAAKVQVDRVKPDNPVNPLKVSEPPTAAERLRAFEDKHFGKRAVRINGQIEQGHGSAFKALGPELQREYAAIERLADAEKALGAAEGSLSVAQSAHASAIDAVENATKASDDAAAAAKKAADEDAAEQPRQPVLTTQEA